jgi:hypothetical protein
MNINDGSDAERETALLTQPLSPGQGNLKQIGKGPLRFQRGGQPRPAQSALARRFAPEVRPGPASLETGPYWAAGVSAPKKVAPAKEREPMVEGSQLGTSVTRPRPTEQKAARSMPSGLPGSKSIRDETPLGPGVRDPTQGPSRVMRGSNLWCEISVRCALAATVKKMAGFERLRSYPSWLEENPA